MKTLIVWLAVLFWPAMGVLADPPPEVIKHALRQAGLSTEQIKKIDEIFFAAEREKLELRHRLQQARLELSERLGAERPDRQAVMELAERIGRLETELRKNRLGLLLDIRAQMTPEQWAQIESRRFHWLKERQGAK